ALWRREALAQLIEQQCGLSLEGTTVGRYLHRWGRSPQKPTAPAREQCPYQVQQW
ncbi:MAG: IS630 family transposase, partial [Cyanobacteria bacterium SW_12_48_29]